MTILRRTGALTLIPGTPGIPATPGWSEYRLVPDPPSQTTMPFPSVGGIGTEHVIGKGETVIVSDGGLPPGGGSYPPTPGTEYVDGYNGEKGKYVRIIYPDGTIRVVKV
ncbi:hypothetical protein [Zoogloea dura]|jgi:hypothetical protein|uniref:Uncharacterized protein n=1 Tax=Zoogloea dura TaxID=2728840 RepID=A0A848G1L5_9RHOO|nr:hypothetical protein [Zoogloea dura]NML24333.1 hypothetical protein [Zoogloea dura]